MSELFDWTVNRTGAEYTQDIAARRARGFRPTTLSVSNGSSDPRYAVTWVLRDGPEWREIHGVDSASYQDMFDTSVAAGFQPVMLSATGPPSAPIFAAIFVQRPGPTPLTRHLLTSGDPNDPGTIEHWNQEAAKNGWVMTCGAVYGDPGSLRFTGIWPPNDAGISWNADGIAETPDDYQARFNAQVAGWARPAFVTLSDHGRYLSIFRDDVVGPMVARHNLTFAELNAEFSRLELIGFVPVSLQAGGFGDPRFAVLFALQEEPLTRKWRATGGPTQGMQAIDDVVRSGMASAGIRGASIAVVQGTRLVAARGYMLAEDGYRVTLPETYFRLASVSKVVTAIAIEQLIQENLLHLDDTLGDVMGSLTTLTGGQPNHDFLNVTIKELLEFRSGVITDVSDVSVGRTTMSWGQSGTS